ncbi:MAG: hypothetical protein HC865_05000 [Cyanobacteria bacterium RU_5_0]|nr:hypothetical protein [Cyanobacteria bacterium RU_5_0]
MMLDEKYAFGTEQIKTSVYYFSVDAEGKPIKLGDGNFGVVYEVCDETEKKFAVKLLYKSQTMNQSFANLRLNDAIIQSFDKEFGLQPTDPVRKRIESLKNLDEENVSTFIYNLVRTEISEEQCRFLLDQIFLDTRSATVKRFEEEIAAAKTIRNQLEKQGNRTGAFNGVIETVCGTKRFRESQAYSTLKCMFGESCIDVSDYALVMPLYDCTLKDLLENGIGKYSVRQSSETEKLFSNGTVRLQELQNLDQQTLERKIEALEEVSPDKKADLKNNIHEMVGYDILESMKFEERISIILPYLRKIAIGLKTLHSVGFFHLDLKPANIFVSKQEELNAVIGDLGFLKPEKASGSTQLANVQDTIPLGTRHFRSPEQKDYFDICNVEILQSTDGGSKKTQLIVRDPKFQDTIIEQKDYLIFSRDKSHTKYEIDEIRHTTDNSTVITLKINEKAHSILKPDKQTQIVLYKRPGTRTDLFGIGAIAFDLITGGNSPERFYDDLRIYDRKEKSIAEIVDMYRSVSSFQASEPGLVHIFAPFKHQYSSSYVPYEFVDLILRCMLYKAKGTFYREQDSDSERNRAINIVLTHLGRLEHQYPSKYVDNALVMGNYNPQTDTTQSAALSDRLKELQNLPLNHLPLRLATGIWYFRELVKLVRRNLSNRNLFFSELLPSNIIADNETIKFIYTIYQNPQDYINDLREDLVHAKIIRSITNPYVPTDITFLRRQVELRKSAHSDTAFQYSFTDSVPHGTSISESDWIVSNSHLYKVVKAVDGIIVIKNATDRNHDVSELLVSANGKPIACTYYKNLDPCVYYLNMLGIYLHQIFFTGLGNTTADQPGLISIAQTRRSMNPHSVSIKEYHIEKRRKEKGLKSILEAITSMYLKLTFTQDGQSFYKQQTSDDQRIISVESETQILQGMIENFVGEQLQRLNVLVDKNWFDAPTANGSSKAQDLMKKHRRVLSSFPKGLEFERLIDSFLFIELHDKPISFGFSDPSKRPGRETPQLEIPADSVKSSNMAEHSIPDSSPIQSASEPDSKTEEIAEREM